MKNILVVGSVNMDYTIYVDEFPSKGETLYGSFRFIQPGGKGENQAVALAKSGIVNTYFIGAVGKDSDGSEIKEVLKKYNVNAHLFELKNIETGNATIVVDGKSENKIVIIKGANGELRPKMIDLELLKKSDCVVLQNEIPEETNEFIIKEAHKLNKIVIYNPAPYRKFNESLLSMIDYFIPNEGELMKYTGCKRYEDGAKLLLNKGVKNVLVTLGTKGSVLYNQSITKVDAFKVKAVDTVAAGDTYVGYFAASIINGYSVKDAMTYASKASSITVQNRGSVISIPFGKDVFE